MLTRSRVACLRSKRSFQPPSGNKRSCPGRFALAPLELKKLATRRLPQLFSRLPLGIRRNPREAAIQRCEYWSPGSNYCTVVWN